MSLKIITWNINSVRLRLPLLLELMKNHDPDVICLQETKTPDDLFPRGPIEDAGYPHMHFAGMKGYNGVAILSRHPLSDKDVHMRCGREDCRHISAMLGGFELHNLYIPAGGYEPDPVNHEKFKHKLDFVEEITDWFGGRYTAESPLVALGDFNIAPYENDVWSHKQLLKVVSHTPAETERLAAFRQTLNWIDTTRHFVPMEEKIFTWWSYRNRDWKKSDRGRRLDHIWVTPPLKETLQSHEVIRPARDWDRPSDHVPVIVTLDVKY